MKPTIKGLRLISLHNAEYIQYFKNVLSIINSEGFNIPEIATAVSMLQSMVIRLDDLFCLPTGNPITKEMQQFDKERDDALKGMKAIAKGYSYSSNETLKGHGAAVAKAPEPLR